MSDTVASKPNDNGLTDSQKLEYASALHSKVVDLAQDWRKVDEPKARLIIECVQDALNAFGETNQEKRIELKEIREKAENIVSPDSIDSLKRRSERVFLKNFYPKNKKLRNTLLIGITLASLLGLSIPLILWLRQTSSGITSPTPTQKGPISANVTTNQADKSATPLPSAYSGDESQVVVEKATVTLDLTSKWIELDREQREHTKLSRGILTGVFSDVRKINKAASFLHRIGTSSNFPPDWRNISPHGIRSEDEMARKCSPNTKYAYLLYFDISKERLNVPFDLKYEIIFWNAHNGEAGDWQSFFVSRHTKQLIMKIKFPKNKPYTQLNFTHAYGVDCQSQDFKDFPNPDVKETIDPETGAKVATWTIESPEDLWIYMISWKW